VTVTAEFAALEGDIARLADLQPGDEATALASSIRARLETPL
jgi:F420-0:gamma-glutamyl ligase